ncbi:MAG: nucleotide exchange factor GrpE [Bradymonadia bacterium]
MSSDSDSPKNDPLFERLFAEAEACLDKKRKAPEPDQQRPSGDASVQPTNEAPKEHLPPLSVKSERSSESPRQRLTREGGLALGGLRQRPPKNEKRANQITADQTNHADALQQAEAKIEKLKGRLTTIKERAKRDQQLALSKQADKMILGFLQLIDDLERALSASVEEGTDSTQFKAYRQGIQQVYDGGQHILSQYGVKRFDPVKERFDPERHEAVRREARTDIEPNHVVEVFQAGYLIDERLLRAARVSVSAPD